MQLLAGKVALITGAGQGIGLGIAKSFAVAGANLVITGRDEAKLKNVVPDLQALGARVIVFAGDAAKPGNAQAAVDAAISNFGQLDVLVNNAQAHKSGVAVEDLDDEALQLAFDSGFLATLRHMQSAFRHMRGRGGSIINFGSKVGIIPYPGTAAYAVSKESIRALSRVAAKEWGCHKIRVNVLNPASLSPKAAAYFDKNPGEHERHLREMPLGYFGDPQTDIGGAAIFLASDQSRYVTGQTLNVDGGQVMA